MIVSRGLGLSLLLASLLVHCGQSDRTQNASGPDAALVGADAVATAVPEGGNVATSGPTSAVQITAPAAGAVLVDASTIAAIVTISKPGQTWLRICYDNNPGNLTPPPPCLYGATNWIADAGSSATWNTAAGVSNGAHLLQVDGWVTSGGVSTPLGSATRAVTVANANAVSITGPTPGASLSDVAWISASVVTAQAGEPWLRICYDNNPQKLSPAPACAYGATNWIADAASSAAWSTQGSVSNGPHVLQVDGWVTANGNSTRVAWAAESVAVSNSAASPTAIAEISFTSHAQSVGPYAFAFDDNLYEINLLNTPSLAPVYSALNASEVRLPLAFYPPANADPATGVVDCNYSGQTSSTPCAAGQTGDAFVKAYRAAGLEPVVIVPIYSYYDPTGCGAADPYCLNHVPSGGWNRRTSRAVRR